MRALAVALAGALAIPASPAPAAACEHAASGTPMLIAPRDAEDGVAPNTLVAVWWNETPPAGAALELRDGASAIPVTREDHPWPPSAVSTRLTPKNPLAPLVSFDVVLTRPGEPDVVVGSFTTGWEYDYTPPAPLFPIIYLHEREACSYDWCCPSAGEVQRATISMTSAPSGFTYDLIDVDENVAWDARAVVEIFAACDGAGLYDSRTGTRPPIQVAPGRRAFRLAMRDRAGNEAMTPPFVIPIDCAEPVGCGCRAGGRAVPPWPALALAIALLVPRRARPPR